MSQTRAEGARLFAGGEISVYCTNHPNIEAVTRCDGCAEPFCKACIVEVQGDQYCGECKVVVVKDRKAPPPRPIKQGEVCEDARNALAVALVGLACCCIGVFMHPLALYMAHQAVERIKYDQRLVGLEVARAAQVTAIAGLVMMVLVGAAFMISLVFVAAAVE